MVNFILKFIDLFRGILTAIGVDYEQLRVILWAKLTMDSRKASGITRKGKKKKNVLVMQVFIYSMMGIMIGILIAPINSAFTLGYIFFIPLMFMIIVALISEFTTILIDTSDNTILLPRPVNSRTILIAKIIHIAVYLMIISLSLSLVSIVIVFIKYGILTGLVFIICIIIACLFTIFLTNLFYLVLMKITSGEKLKDIIAYFQVFMAIVFMGAFQLLPRLSDKIDMSNISFDISWWTYFVPPAWMSGTLDAFANKDFGPGNLIFMGCTIIIPLIGLWMVSKIFAPTFTKRLSQIDQGSNKKKHKVKNEKRQNIQYWYANILTRNASEFTAFILTWKLSSRDRKFKQTVYPSFGYVFIFLLVFLFQKEGNIEDLFKGVGQNKLMFYMLLYFPVFIIFSVLASLRFSDEYKAAWIYEAFPVESPGNILSGGLKAVLVKLYFPFYIVIGVIVLLIWGTEKIPDLLLAFFNILLFTSLLSRLTIFSFPFSEERIIQESGSRMIKNIIFMLLAGVIGFLHWGLNYLDINALFILPVVVAAMILIFRSYRLLTWDKFRAESG
ncbi:hypothetical protein ACFLSI_02930 [Bacteroidota bacterium]